MCHSLLLSQFVVSFWPFEIFSVVLYGVGQQMHKNILNTVFQISSHASKIAVLWLYACTSRSPVIVWVRFVIFFMFLYKYDLIHHQILTQVPKVDEFNWDKHIQFNYYQFIFLMEMIQSYIDLWLATSNQFSLSPTELGINSNEILDHSKLDQNLICSTEW